MTEGIVQIPFKLVSVTVVGVMAAATLTLLLAWHGLRRLLDVPRVPRPAGMYLVLGVLWIGLAVTGAMSVATMLLLRDHQRVDVHTQLADVRCEAAGPGQVRAELRTSRAATPEQYDFPGDTCIVAVRQVELRPGLGLLGVRMLSRVDGVGPVQRPAERQRFIDLVARRTEAVPVTVPADGQVHAVVVSSLSGPALDLGKR